MHWINGALAHGLIGAIAVMAYVFQTRAHAERRPPSAAITWVLSLALLPYAALPLYLTFGRRKEARPHPPRAAIAMDEDMPWPAQLLCAFAAPRHGAMRFDANGAQALASAHALIDGAQRSLDVATFILGGREDAVARGLLDAMAAAAARGVRVRLLLDGLASRRIDIAAVAARGIETKWFRRRSGVPTARRATCATIAS